MTVPEFVIIEGVRIAWKFLQERDFVVGMIAEELPVEKQESYRDTLRNEQPFFSFQYPNTTARLPAFTVSLLGEDESPEGQFLNDDGVDLRELPHPPEQIEDFAIYDDFQRFTYPDEEAPVLSSVVGKGDYSSAEVTNNPLPRHNQAYQRTEGDEQYNDIRHPYRAYHIDGQKLGFRTVGSTAQFGITVTTNNAEKTVLYVRLLLHVLRQFSTWFHLHGLHNATFSASGLTIDESLQPVGNNPAAPFSRQITMRFLFFDQHLEVSKVLMGWIFEIGLATPNASGGLDFTKISEVSELAGLKIPQK